MARFGSGVWKVLLLASTIAAVACPPAAFGQQPAVVERLFRSVLTSVKPVFAPGQEGNPNAAIGFNTESTVYEINQPIEQGLIPPPRLSGAEPIGRMFGELRCIGAAHVDKSKPLQVFVGKARFVGRAMTFEAQGTSIIHWCKDENGRYNGIRWTDFSGAMTKIEGRRQGSKGHVVGTRLLAGDPDLKGQSGLLIVRFAD